MNSYKRLNPSEREELALQLALGLSLRLIAKSLGRAPSTLSREIKRSSGNRSNYRMLEAQNQADINAYKPRKKRKLESNIQLRTFVLKCLNNYWTPEQIAKRLKILYPDDMTMRISPRFHHDLYSYFVLSSTCFCPSSVDIPNTPFKASWQSLQWAIWLPMAFFFFPFILPSV